MKFVQVERLRGGELTYIVEGSTKVKPGDVVVAPIYSHTDYMTVLRVGATREAIKSNWTGAVKTIVRVATDRERRAIVRIKRAEEALSKAQAALMTAEDAANQALSGEASA